MTLARPAVHALPDPRIAFDEADPGGQRGVITTFAKTVSSRVSAVGPAPITMGGSKDARAYGDSGCGRHAVSPTFEAHLFFCDPFTRLLVAPPRGCHPCAFEAWRQRPHSLTKAEP